VYEGYCVILLVTRPRIPESNEDKSTDKSIKKLIRLQGKSNS